MIESKAFQNSLAAWECMQFKTNTEACREGRCISWLLLPHTPHLELSASKAQAHFPIKDIAGSRTGAYLPTSYIYMHASSYNGHTL